jgi:site-specific recombinase XerD
LKVSDFQQREDHWGYRRLDRQSLSHSDNTGAAVGEGGRRRLAALGRNLKWQTLQARDARRHLWGSGLSEKVVWHVVRLYARKAGVEKLAPHDLRRTCARLCHQAGGELDQIQFLLGHVSVQTTERYLGCKQRIRNAVNDRIGIQPKPRSGSDT